MTKNAPRQLHLNDFEFLIFRNTMPNQSLYMTTYQKMTPVVEQAKTQIRINGFCRNPGNFNIVLIRPPSNFTSYRHV